MNWLPYSSHTSHHPSQTPGFLESLMSLKHWCLIHARFSKSSLKHSIHFCVSMETYWMHTYVIVGQYKCIYIYIYMHLWKLNIVVIFFLTEAFKVLASWLVFGVTPGGVGEESWGERERERQRCWPRCFGLIFLFLLTSLWLLNFLFGFPFSFLAIGLFLL